MQSKSLGGAFGSIETLVKGGQGWVKSSRSTASNCCVEVKSIGPDHVAIRDSKFRQDPMNELAAEPFLIVATAVWQGLLTSLQNDDISLVSGLKIDMLSDHSVVIESVSGEISLTYTSQEWDAFMGGINDGEFDHIGLAVPA